MKLSNLGNIYLLELASATRPELREVLPDLLAPATARYARGFVMAILKGLGYEPAFMSREAAKVARKAIKQADPLAYVKAQAALEPLVLTDEEAALRACGLGVEEARALSVTPKGMEAARAVNEGRYAVADRLLAGSVP